MKRKRLDFGRLKILGDALVYDGRLPGCTTFLVDRDGEVGQAGRNYSLVADVSLTGAWIMRELLAKAGVP